MTYNPACFAKNNIGFRRATNIELPSYLGNVAIAKRVTIALTLLRLELISYSSHKIYRLLKKNNPSIKSRCYPLMNYKQQFLVARIVIYNALFWQVCWARPEAQLVQKSKWKHPVKLVLHTHFRDKRMRKKRHSEGVYFWTSKMESVKEFISSKSVTLR